MSKKNYYLFIFFIFFKSFPLLNSFTTIKLSDFTKVSFTLKEYVILEYTNNIKKDFDYEINFIFDEGNKVSTKAFYYDSFDKIQKGDTGFINYLYSTSLKETRILKISYNEPFYRDKANYYIVLYDISKSYTDSVYLLNSLSYFPLKDSIFYHNSLSQELHFNFLVQESTLKYLHYQARENGRATSYFRITNEKGERFIDTNCYGCSGYVKIKPNIKYYIETALYARGDSDKKEMLFKLENYGRNILLEEDKQVERQILSPQNLTFFTSISNLNIDDNVYFKFEISRTGEITNLFYIKIYESDNFTKLENSFPLQEENFDYKIYKIKTLTDNGKFVYEFKKNLIAQKGILIGVFIESSQAYSTMSPTTIKAIFSKKDLFDKKYIINIIIIIIISIIIFGVIIYCCYKHNCKGNRYYSSYRNYNVNDDDDESEYAVALVKVKKRKN